MRAPFPFSLLLILLAFGCGEDAQSSPEGAPETAAATPEDAPPPSSEATARELESPDPDAVLWVGGDVLVSDAIRDFARTDPDPARGFARVFESITPMWREPGAFVLVNLEMPVADERRHALDAEPVNPQGLTAVHLHGPSWLPAGLARAGVHGVTLANNHALDQDRDGLLETIAASRRAGLVVAGAGVYPEHRWPLRMGPPGREFCVLNFYDARGPGAHEPGEVARSVLDEEAFALVHEARSRCAAVVPVVHVLGELVAQPKPAWRAWARRLVQAGASAIVVHGTHVVLPVERIEGVPVVWGLGNLVSDMGRLARPGDAPVRGMHKESDPATRETLLVRLSLDARGAVALRLVAAWMSNDRIPRWRGAMPGEEIRFALRPMSRCTPPLLLRGWPAAHRSAVESWVARRREHVLEVTGLTMDDCAPDAVPWLRLAQ